MEIAALVLRLSSAEGARDGYDFRPKDCGENEGPVLLPSITLFTLIGFKQATGVIE